MAVLRKSDYGGQRDESHPSRIKSALNHNYDLVSSSLHTLTLPGSASCLVGPAYWTATGVADRITEY
jgi:hypothetical protein